MMKRRAEMKLTGEDMRTAVTFWLNECVLRESVEVTGINEATTAGAQAFLVMFVPVDEDEDEG